MTGAFLQGAPGAGERGGACIGPEAMDHAGYAQGKTSQLRSGGEVLPLLYVKSYPLRNVPTFPFHAAPDGEGEKATARPWRGGQPSSFAGSELSWI